MGMGAIPCRYRLQAVREVLTHHAFALIDCHHSDITPRWLRQLPDELTVILVFAAEPNGRPAHRYIVCEEREPAIWFEQTKTLWAGQNVLLLRAGHHLPRYWWRRLADALHCAQDIGAALPLSNTCSALSPLAPGISSHLSADQLDSLIYQLAPMINVDTTVDSTTCVLVSHEVATVMRSQQCGFDEALSHTRSRAVICDHLYLPDPTQPLSGPPPDWDDEYRDSESPLASLRLKLTEALRCPPAPGYPGLDDMAVKLHVSHSWGGGVARWIADYVEADQHNYHLILSSHGDWHQKIHGIRYELRRAESGTLIDRWTLPVAIHSTTATDHHYGAILRHIIERYGVGQTLVSSLIGHTLEVLTTGIPTTWLLHDYFPACPALNMFYGEPCSSCDAERLSQCASDNPCYEWFIDKTADQWMVLRGQLNDKLSRGHLRIVAPTQHVLDRLSHLLPALSGASHTVIGHGISQQWAELKPLTPPPVPAPRERLRVVVPGRLSQGKGIRLLLHALEGLADFTEIYLVGCGKKGREFFGKNHVHIITDFEHHELPALLGQIRPHLAALLSTVPETFSYTLSELSLLGVPVVATRLGSFEERIQDGRNGLLIDPHPDALVAKLRWLHSNSEVLLEITSALAEMAVITTSQTLERYTQLQQPKRTTDTLPERRALTADDLTSIRLADNLMVAQRELNVTDSRLGEAERELTTRLEWARDLEGQLIQRTEWTKQLEQSLAGSQEELDSRLSWARKLERELEKRTEWAGELEGDLSKTRKDFEKSQRLIDKRTAWAQDLDLKRAELEIQVAQLKVDIAIEQNELVETKRELTEAELVVEQSAMNMTSLRQEIRAVDEARVNLQEQVAAQERQRLLAERERDQISSDFLEMETSTFWRITAPARHTITWLRRKKAGLGFRIRRLLSLLARARKSVQMRGISATARRIRTHFDRVQPISSTRPSPALLETEPLTLATSGKPLVSIVIPVFNQFDYTYAALRSIAEHDSGIAFEVIVVDDCSSDQTARRVPIISGLRSFRNDTNLGFVGSCNRGARMAKGEYLLFLNNDTTVTPGWLQALVDSFSRFPDTGLVGAKLVYPDGRLQEAGGIVFSDGSGWNYGRFEDPADTRFSYAREVDYCSGACIMLRRATFEELGGFDQRYAPAYYEDTDLAFQIRAIGQQVIYQPAATVIHYEGISCGTETDSGLKQYQVVNHKKFLSRWRESLLQQPTPGAEQIELAKEHRVRRRALVIDACTPMPDQDSGSVRMTYFMQILQQLGYKVTFFVENLAHHGHYTEALQASGVEMLYAPWMGTPEHFFESRGRDFELIVLSRHYVAKQFLNLIQQFSPKARVLFDTVDLHYLREQRQAALEGDRALAKTAERTKREELRVAKRCDVTLVVSPVEKIELATEIPKVPVVVVSNIHHVHGRRNPYSKRRDIMFVGGYQHPPNVDAVRYFVEQVFPKIRTQIPDIKFHVIGSRVPPEIEAMNGSGVVVHGFVEDLEPMIERCRIAVAPLRYGAGVKGKVNMSMSYGQPVVATSVAVEGMNAEHGVDVLIGDTADEFGAAVVRLYNDNKLWARLSRNSLKNVERYFSFEAAKKAIVTAIE